MPSKEEWQEIIERHREKIGGTTDQFKEDGWSVEVQGNPSDPDCVIIRPKENEEYE